MSNSASSPTPSPPPDSEDSRIAALLNTLDQIIRIDLGSLLQSAANPAQLIQQIRTRITDLIAETEEALARLRHRLQEVERAATDYRAAEQRETSRALVARSAGQLAVAEQASERAHHWEHEAERAENLRHGVAAQIRKLGTALETLRVLLSRIGQSRGDPQPDASAGGQGPIIESEALRRARTLAQEIDELNSSAFRKIQEMRDRAGRDII